MRTLTTVLTTGCAALAALALPAPTWAAGFTGSTDPSLFTTSNVGTLIGGAPSLGSATFSAVQLVLVGSNSTSPAPGGTTPGCSSGQYGAVGSPCQVQTILNAPGIYTFNWSYVTFDNDGPAGDIFGVMVNGARIALSDPGGANVQTGTRSIVATSAFGWFMNCTDCIGGFATATISGLQVSPVPEPAGQALLLVGLAALAGVHRHRRTKGD
jgi:hypothetical protein